VNKLGKHRSRLQILENILSVISGNDGARKTQIMYQAYLSYKLLSRYLNDVLNAGLVVCDNGTSFRLTQKGERFLARFGEYHRSREVVEKNLNHVEDQKVMLEEMCPNSEVENGVQMARDRAKV
jgi:predicted transcriptional regulator